ncbi:MAG: phosphoglycerate kinase [Pseudomonadota bacterium]
MTIKYIDQLDIKDKRVFIRVDFNVAMKDGVITDDTRIKKALPTIKYALDQKAKVILASHLGRPKGEVNPKYSMKPVGQRLAELLGNTDVLLPEDCVGDAVKKLAHDLEPGQVMLLENLRFHKEETANDENFSKQLASLAQVYINDAFGTCHRAHASTFGMAQFCAEKGAGFLLKAEIENLSKVTANPEKPFVVILGGAKVSDKIGVIENLMTLATSFIIGGGMAYTFLKAKGQEVGKSLLEEDKLHTAKKILERATNRDIPIHLPVDNIVANEITENAKFQTVEGDIPDNMMGVDIGPKTIAQFEKSLNGAKTIFWNGPMGVFEIPAFAKGTMALAKAVAASPATSIIGGGDSVSAVNKAGVADKITHISTGGGASLEFVEGKEMPGIQALESKNG